MKKIDKFTFHWWHSSEYCEHADKDIWLVDVIIESINKWMKFRGLIEHMPRIREFFYPEEVDAWIQWDELFHRFEEFVKIAKMIKWEYSHKIKILVWMETEMLWMDSIWDILKLKKKHDLDYLVWSVHHVNNYAIDFSSEIRNEIKNDLWWEKEIQLEYYKSMLKLVKWARPEVIGHLDLIKLWSDKDFDPSTDDDVSWLVDEIINEVNSYWWVFEVNTRAFKKWFSTPYPSPWIMNKILEKWWELTVWDDSHWVTDIWFKFKKAIKYTKEHWFEYVVVLKESKNPQKTKDFVGKLFKEKEFFN